LLGRQLALECVRAAVPRLKADKFEVSGAGFIGTLDATDMDKLFATLDLMGMGPNDD
jgi:hypothetical protein